MSSRLNSISSEPSRLLGSLDHTCALKLLTFLRHSSRTGHTSETHNSFDPTPLGWQSSMENLRLQSRQKVSKINIHIENLSSTILSRHNANSNCSVATFFPFSRSSCTLLCCLPSKNCPRTKSNCQRSYKTHPPIELQWRGRQHVPGLIEDHHGSDTLT